MSNDTIYIIGIGYRPLDEKAEDIVLNADYILTSDSLLEIFKKYEEYETVMNKVKVIDNVDDTIAFIRDNYKRASIALLAVGDPMFYGIGRKVINEFGKDNVEVFPDLSSIQMAFSRIKEPWTDAFLVSFHGGPDPTKRRKLEYKIEELPVLLKKHKKIGILTDRTNNPSVIARVLQSSIKMYVCERLGYPDEKIIEGTPEEIAQGLFRNPNVVIIQSPF